MNLFVNDFEKENGFFLTVDELTAYCKLRNIQELPTDNTQTRAKKKAIKTHLFNLITEYSPLQKVIACNYEKDYEVSGFFNLSFKDHILAAIKDVKHDFFHPYYIKERIL